VAESRVNEHEEVLSRMTSEIIQIESMLRDDQWHGIAKHECTESAVKLPGETLIVKQQNSVIDLLID